LAHANLLNIESHNGTVQW